MCAYNSIMYLSQCGTSAEATNEILYKVSVLEDRTLLGSKQQKSLKQGIMTALQHSSVRKFLY